MRKFKVKETVTEAMAPWLNNEDLLAFRQDAVVFEYLGPTYGCIGDGIAVSVRPNMTPFFELPEEYLEEIKD